MKRLCNEKYAYLAMFVLSSIALIFVMYGFNKFLSNVKNYQTFVHWQENQRLIADIHRHPKRYPDLNPDGTRKAIPGPRQEYDPREISNAFELSEKNMVPFQIKNGTLDFGVRLDAPAGKYGFIRVKNGHFVHDEHRVQFAGINNAYEANFPPTKADAEALATTLAQFGFNCVRLHHCDERGFWGTSGDKTIFDPKKMDMFDYGIFALKQKGIYVNLNLHVSRYLGHNEGLIPSTVLFDKGIDNFDTRIRELNKKFAKDLLEHVNPYTGNAYKDEPAIAMIEMNNENSIIQIWKNGSLDKADEFYLHELRTFWNQFLQGKYQTDTGLREACGFKDIPLGAEMVPGLTAALDKRLNQNLKLVDRRGDPIQENVMKKVEVEEVGTALSISGLKKDGRELKVEGIPFQAGKTYTFSVDLRTNVPGSMLLRFEQGEKERRVRGNSMKVYTSNGFESYDYVFVAGQTGSDGAVCISGFLEGINYEILSVSVREGGKIAWPKIDDRPKAEEDHFDQYTTSLIEKKPVKVLGSIELPKILDGQLSRPVSGIEFSAQAARTYRVDMIATASIQSPVGIRFIQDGKELSFVADERNNPVLSGTATVLSFKVRSESKSKIAISAKNVYNSASYKFDIVQVRPVQEINNDQFSLDTMTIPILFSDGLSRWPETLQRDWLDFLLALDKSHWQDMYDYLKETVGVKQLVTGTQLEYGSMQAQAGTDFCDSHGYWDHPVFLNRPWDANDWYMHNQPIVNVLDRSPLLNLATKRVAGKPFTCTEYCHVWINRYSAEGMPLLALLAASHGWDGIFPYCWSGNSIDQPGAMTGFFEMKNNTVQLAHSLACNNLILRDYRKDADSVAMVAPLSEKKEQEIFREKKHAYSFGFNGLGLDMRNALLRPTAIDATGKASDPKVARIPEDQLVFDSKIGEHDYITVDLSEQGSGFVTAKVNDTALFTGFVKEGRGYAFGEGEIVFGRTNMGWATVTMTKTASDRNSVTYLLVATGEMRNTDQQYQRVYDNKITLNNAGIDSTGTAPVLCECLPFQLVFDDAKYSASFFPLDQSGKRRKEVLAKVRYNGLTLNFQPDMETIWYEVKFVTKP